MKKAKKKPLVVVGDSVIAQVAYEYFTHDSPYTVAAFTVEKKYLKQKKLCGLPVVPFEDLTKSHPPAKYDAFVAIAYGQLNRLRARFFDACRADGYALASYVSSRAFVWRNVEIGQNCFILEDNTVQPFVKIGDDTVLWSGNHIGHHSVIGRHVFIASQAVIAGGATIEDHCFVGINATIAHDTRVKRDCLIGAGALITKDTEPDRIYSVPTTAARDFSAKEYFKVPHGS